MSGKNMKYAFVFIGVIAILLLTNGLVNAELPPEILAEKYLKAAKKYVKEQKWSLAEKNFEKAMALDFELPDAVTFFYGKTLYEQKKYKKAKENIEAYISKTGRGGKYYDEGLNLLIQIDTKIEVQRKKQVELDRKRKAEAKRKKQRAQKLSNELKKMKFVYIKPGSFMMGDYSKHEVTLTKGFNIQTTEVTQGLWKAVMGKNPSYFKNCGDNCPVENVSWNDVQAFIRKLNQKAGSNKYRLPTEAEWEYTCRAGSTTKFSFGDSESSLGAYAWYKDNSGDKTHPVGQKSPNAWGLYDMHGNVWEWCQDWSGDYPSGAVTNPKGLSSGSFRVFRGGSWYGSAGGCESARRRYGSPGDASFSLGFRLTGQF